MNRSENENTYINEICEIMIFYKDVKIYSPFSTVNQQIDMTDLLL